MILIFPNDLLVLTQAEVLRTFWAQPLQTPPGLIHFFIPNKIQHPNLSLFERDNIYGQLLDLGEGVIT